MDEKNEKAVKNGFSQARRSYGEGYGLVRGGLRRLLNRIFFRRGRIWLQSKVDRAKEEDHAWLSYQLSFVAETTWSPKW
jgi:hypothetical protein